MYIYTRARGRARRGSIRVSLSSVCIYIYVCVYVCVATEVVRSDDDDRPCVCPAPLIAGTLWPGHCVSCCTTLRVYRDFFVEIHSLSVLISVVEVFIKVKWTVYAWAAAADAD